MIITILWILLNLVTINTVSAVNFTIVYFTHIGADWGYDEVFCTAAKKFARETLESPFIPKSFDSTIHCALIIGGTPVMHVNKHTTDSIVGVGTKLAVDCELVSLMSHSFPTYSVNGNVGGCSPDNPNYIKVYQLKDKCQFEY